MDKASEHLILIVPIDKIVIDEDRQRKEVDEKKVEELANSIETFGLLHPLTVFPREDKYILIAGFRRLQALKMLAERGGRFQFSGKELNASLIPVVLENSGDFVRRKEIELEENLRRVNLSWKEEAQAIAELHELRKSQNPDHRTEDTAEEVSRYRGPTRRQVVTQALAVAQSLDDPDVARSPSLTSAYEKVIKKTKRDIEAALLRISEEKQSSFILHEEDFRKVKFEGKFDCIIADPPYGIGSEKFAKATLAHQYEDKDIEIARAVIDLASNSLKKRGVLFLFCDIEHFITLREYAKSKNLGCRRTPLIWYHPCVGHDASGIGSGFRRNSELILCAWVGRPPFKGISDDVFIVDHVSRSERVHPAQKPVELYAKLLDSCCTVGARVLDPCCGSGTIFKAARKLKLKAVGCENGIYAKEALVAAKGEK